MNYGVKEAVASDISYKAGQLAKGQGNGTQLGWYMSNAQQYIDVYIQAVNVFNYCDFNYYLRAAGQWFSASGGTNQAINFMWRFLSTEDMTMYYNLSVAVKTGNVQTAGQEFGKFLALFMQVEIPDTASAPSYQEVGQLM